MLAAWSGSLAAAAVQNKKTKLLPRVGEFVRLVDPTTETVVVRLTALTSTNLLPAPTNKFVSTKDRFLVFASDRGGAFAPFQVSLRNGLIQQLAETSDMDPRSLSLDQSERFLYLIDKGELKEISLANKKVRTVTEDVSAFGIGHSTSDVVIVRKGELRVLNGGTLAGGVTSGCLVRPGGNGCFFGRDVSGDGTEFWYAPYGDSKPQLLAKGSVSFPFWSPDGKSLLFLRDVEKNGTVLSEIRQVAIESGVEEAVAPTSQFAAFSPNADASVFVGASRSKAQPDVVLLLRTPHREMTLCEHHSKSAAFVTPVFSPDSRRVYFESDREGKPAVYSVNVELLVEAT
jgi:oligogalacturonide lyase